MAFKNYINNNLLQNYIITIDYINREEDISGTPTPILQGKIKITNPICVTKHPGIPLPLPIASNHKHVQVCTYLFYFNNKPFLHTKSGNIQFLSVQSFKSHSTKTITEGLNIFGRIYHSKGLIITNFNRDNKFDIKTLHKALTPATLHIYAKTE